MPVIAVGVKFEQHGALAAGQNCFGAGDGVADCQHIHAVDDFRVHIFIIETGGAAGQEVNAVDFAVSASGHAEMVVDDTVNDRQPEFGAGDFTGELFLTRPVERFQHHAVGISAVAGKTADDAFFHFFINPAGHCRAGGDRDAAADNCIGAQVSDAEVGNVHAAPAAFAVTGFFAEQFGDGAVNMVFHHGFAEFFALQVGIFRTACFQFGFVHPFDGVEALGDGIAVAAVRGSDKIADVECGTGPGCGGFLPDGQMGRAAIFIVADDFIRAGTALQNHFFEFTDYQHGLIEFQQFRLGDAFGGQFFLRRRIVLIGRNALQFDGPFLKIRTKVTEIISHFQLLDVVIKF